MESDKKKLKPTETFEELIKKQKPSSDMFDDLKSQPHYMEGIQPIKYLESRMSPAQLSGYLEGNIIKYISRYHVKGEPIKDLTKAKVYFKFGIYRSYLKQWIYSSRNKKKEKGVPAQVVYFDEVRAGKTKEKVVGNLPPL